MTEFRHPVTVFIGLGFPRQVYDASEAYELLTEMPAHMQSPAYQTALKACRAALNGDVDGKTARGVFERFARARGILADEAFACVAREAERDLLSA